MSRYFLSSDKQPARSHSSEPDVASSLYIHPASQSLNTQHAVSEHFTLYEQQWADVQRQIRYHSCPQRIHGLIKPEINYKGWERKRNKQLEGGQMGMCATDSRSLINPNPYFRRGISPKYLTILQSSFYHFHCFLLDQLPISLLRL